MWNTIFPISAMTLDSDTFEFQMNLGRLSLQKLVKKIPANAVPDETRDKLTGVLCRDHLTTRQDINNIMQQYNLNLV